MGYRLPPWIVLLALVAGAANGQAPDGADRIRLSQVGFYPDGPKTAVVVDAPETPFFVVDVAQGDTVFAGRLGDAATWEWSGESVRRAAFSGLDREGTFRLVVPGVGTSHPFEVAPDVHREVARATLKALYYQRASAPLPPAYAGPWSRVAGHPDTAVVVHASAASPGRPEGTRIASPGGWYDAGDYNKYVVPAAFTSYFLLAAYAQEPDYFTGLETTIPETGNALPDVLDEALWNLRWMRTMQDPADRGVYHKLTHARFSGMVMPEQATEPRYVVQKSTAAALTFAAAFAQASRVFRAFDDALPGLADSSLTAALDAWRWARAYPDAFYNQRRLNQQYDPDLSTGAYGDDELADEWSWAAAELHLATAQDSFFQAVDLGVEAPVPYWESSVTLLGHLSLVAAGERGRAGERARQAVLQAADRQLALQDASAYGTAVNERGDFIWGGNGLIAAKAAVLLEAFRLTGETAYRDAAVHVVDYLLGRNATAYSFVTGIGARPPMHPHHRPSVADGVVPPVPGLLVGGPAAVRVPDCPTYPSDHPAQRYLDDVCSYSTNEITTYWNAPLTYAAAVLDAAFREE